MTGPSPSTLTGGASSPGSFSSSQSRRISFGVVPVGREPALELLARHVHVLLRRRLGDGHDDLPW